MRLQEAMEDHIFKRVLLLSDIIKNGIMDFLVSSDTDGGKIFDPDFYNQLG
jgi:hypothetical protein